jgi:thiamine biosynthesis lipoprotein
LQKIGKNKPWRKLTLRKIIITLCLFVSIFLTACGSEKTKDIPSATDEIFAMDTYMTITCYGEKCQEALAAALEEIQRLDALLSVGNADSEISIINKNKSAAVSEDTLLMVKQAIELGNTTNGAFDITVYPLMVLWGFTTGDFAVPKTEQIQSALESVGSSRIKLDEKNSTITLEDGQGIDLGGIAKGFTSNRLMEIFSEYGLVSGIVSLGGNVECYGTKPDGSLWKCGIINPLEPDDVTSLLGVVSVEDKAVITSGAYERYFEDEETGKTYHHILNPKTGYPANNGLISVSVVSGNGMLADALSTACYVMGLDESIQYWRQYGGDFDLILMTEDKEVYVTEPISDSFSSDLKTIVIERNGK